MVKGSSKVPANKESTSSQNPGLPDFGDAVWPPTAFINGARRVLLYSFVMCIYFS